MIDSLTTRQCAALLNRLKAWCRRRHCRKHGHILGDWELELALEDGSWTEIVICARCGFTGRRFRQHAILIDGSTCLTVVLTGYGHLSNVVRRPVWDGMAFGCIEYRRTGEYDPEGRAIFR